MNPQNLLKSLLILCVLGGLFVSGCDDDSSQRITQVQSVINRANAVSQSVDVQIEQLEATIQSSQLLLSDPNIPEDMKPQIQKVLDIAQAKLIRLKTEKAKITASLVKWQAIIDNAADSNNMDLAGEIQTYAAMTSAASTYLPPPYSGYVYLGSTLAAALAGLIASVIKNTKQGQQIDSSKTRLTDLVISVDKLLDPEENNGILPAGTVGAAKAVLRQNQDRATSALVDAIHNPMKNTGPTK